MTIYGIVVLAVWLGPAVLLFHAGGDRRHRGCAPAFSLLGAPTVGLISSKIAATLFGDGDVPSVAFVLGVFLFNTLLVFSAMRHG